MITGRCGNSLKRLWCFRNGVKTRQGKAREKEGGTCRCWFPWQRRNRCDAYTQFRSAVYAFNNPSLITGLPRFLEYARNSSLLTSFRRLPLAVSCWHLFLTPATMFTHTSWSLHSHTTHFLHNYVFKTDILTACTRQLAHHVNAKWQSLQCATNSGETSVSSLRKKGTLRSNTYKLEQQFVYQIQWFYRCGLTEKIIIQYIVKCHVFANKKWWLSFT